MPTGALYGPGTDQPSRVGQENNLKQQGRRIGRGATPVIAKTLIKLGELHLVINQMTQRVFEGARQDLERKIDGNELRTHINRLVASHRGIPSWEILMPRACPQHPFSAR